MADIIRKNALETLLHMDEHPSAEVKRTLEKHPEWNHRDGAFYAALVETAVSRLITIDAVIAAYSSVRLKKLNTVVLASLRLALAQILFMDRVPDSAATNEAVNLLKAEGTGKFAGFVNGILRHIIREKNQLMARIVLDNTSVKLKHINGHWQVCDRKQTSYQSVCDKALRLSYPVWIVEFFEKAYPGKTILEGLSSKRQITAISKVSAEEINAEAMNASKISSEEINPKKSYASQICTGAEIADGIFLITFSDGVNPAELKAFKDGLFYIMDRSSMEPLRNASLKNKSTVLDLCASPGGKSVCAAWLYGAQITSCDISEEKTYRIKENVQRLDLYDKISVSENDAEIFNPEWEGKFDAVIADCPCSGLGVSGRKPEIRLRLKSEDFTELSEIQKRILENAARYLKSGGTFIYSTCTLDPVENEELVDAFLKTHPEFSLVNQQTIFPDESHDGFFYSIMKL
jgi:16S rRNA (cytosine967-C5)-methyltransferase